MQGYEFNVPAFMQALQHNNIFPSDNHIVLNKFKDPNEVLLIAEALKSGKCPPKMFLNICHINSSTSRSWSANLVVPSLVEALISGNCPPQLAISISAPLSIELVRELAAALESGQCPENLSMAVRISDPLSMVRLGDALASGKCPRGLSLEFLFPSEKALSALITALQKGQCPKNLKLVFPWPGFYSSNLTLLAQALDSGQCPEGLTLQCHLNSSNEINASPYNLLIKAVSGGNSPTGLKITLLDSESFNIEAVTLGEGLKKGTCPPGLDLSLQYTSFDKEGMQALIDGLASKHCPNGLRFKFSNIKMSDAAIDILAEGLRAKQFPSDFSFDFSLDKPSNHGVITLAKILKEGIWPAQIKFPKIYGDNNNNEAVTALAEGIASNSFSTEFNLVIPSSYLSLEKASEAILDTFNSQQSPKKIIAIFEDSFQDRETMLIINALKARHGHKSIQLDFSSAQLSTKNLESLAEILLTNTTITAFHIPDIFHDQGPSAQTVKLINHGCLRNNLIQKYHYSSEYVSLIKSMSHAAGLYLPCPFSNNQSVVPSLKYQTGSFFVSKMQDQYDAEELKNSLPEDLLEFLTLIEELEPLKKLSYVPLTSPPTPRWLEIT